MRRYIGIGVAWLGATALSVFIASAAVAGIRDRVAEAPVAIGAPTTTTTTLAPADTSTTTAVTTSTLAPTTTEPEQVTTTTEEPAASTTTQPPETATTSTTTTTSTTEPPATTTTTTTAAPATTQTYTLIGGSVTLSVGDGVVSIASLAPAAGFRAEIEKDGPKEVEVEFVSNDHKSELSAKFEGGELKVEKEEEPRDGDEGE